jgi:hypothetical protein
MDIFQNIFLLFINQSFIHIYHSLGDFYLKRAVSWKLFFWKPTKKIAREEYEGTKKLVRPSGNGPKFLEMSNFVKIPGSI